MAQPGTFQRPKRVPLNLRVREEDLVAWKEAAYRSDISLSEWIRRRLNTQVGK